LKKTGLALLAVLLGASASAAERVVTLAPHLAELVCAAGACAKLVGVVDYTDYPPEAVAKPHVGDAFSVNAEVILGLHPDLILSWDGGTAPALTAKLAALGVPVLPVGARTLDDVAQALETVGERLGSASVAHTAARTYRERLADLRHRYAGRAPLRVFYQIEARPAYTINRQSPISQAIETCGGVNVFADLPQLASAIEPEALLAANPDVVVFGKQDYVDEIRAQWAAWPHSRAQRSSTLYAVDSNLLERQAPRVLDGVEELCGVLQQARDRLSAGAGDSR
jgi:iron complex transport system substrate-binding protein